jgi:hypothetical protein
VFMAWCVTLVFPVRFQGFTAVTTENAVFWKVMPCGYYKNRRCGGTYCLHYQSERIGELGITLTVTSKRSMLRSLLRLLVNAKVVPSSPILVNLIMQFICSSEMPVLTRATRHNFSEDGILLSLSFPYNIATGYGLQHRGIGIRLPVVLRMFIPQHRPDRLWGPPIPYPVGTGSKAAEE